jgi:hypothetical protein
MPLTVFKHNETNIWDIFLSFLNNNSILVSFKLMLAIKHQLYFSGNISFKMQDITKSIHTYH